MASDCGLHRHTIGKLYRNQLSSPSLEVLGKVCNWLVDRGVPPDVLPGALFGWQPSDLWRAVAAPRRVTIYMGEYQQIDEDIRSARRWIALRDSAVAWKITEHLSAPPEKKDKDKANDTDKGKSKVKVKDIPPAVRSEYVPFRFMTPEAPGDEQQFKSDITGAKKIFKKMQSRATRETAILIGSQRVNYLVELVVADLFGCKPFKRPNTAPEVPFYLVYRDFDRAVESCFAGRQAPPGYEGAAAPGTYYLDEDDQWSACEWKPFEKDAGLLITVRDPATGSLRVLLFGFSGHSTAVMGAKLIEIGDRFWKQSVTMKGKEIGVHICHIAFAPKPGERQGDGFRVKKLRIVSLSEKVLERYLR